MKIRAVVSALAATLSASTMATAVAHADVKARPSRGFGQGKYALELDNVKCGRVTDVRRARAASATTSGDISVSFGTGMCQGLYQWVSASLSSSAAKKSGTLVGLDADGRELSRLDFSGALITELGMPALDTASRDAAKMTLKFKPEVTHKVRRGSGALYARPEGDAKRWLPAHFRFTAEGLEKALAFVSNVGRVVVKQKVAEHVTGANGGVSRPSRVGASLPLTIKSDNDVTDYYEGSALLAAWAERFLVKGVKWEGPDFDALTKTGRLDYLASDRKTVLFSLGFTKLRATKLTPAVRALRTQAQLRLELAYRDLTFTFTPAALQ